MLKELNNAMEYIEVHLEDEFLLEKISKHINVSDYHFRKIFFALTSADCQLKRPPVPYSAASL